MCILGIKTIMEHFRRWMKKITRGKPLKGHMIFYEPSTSSDVVSYFLYYEKFPKEVSYESDTVDLGQVSEVDLTLYLQIKKKYNIGISAVDRVGNESDLQLLTLTIKKT